jgi:FtsZ-binding cell division protein ZapB
MTGQPPKNENLVRLRKRFDDHTKTFRRAHSEELFNEARALAQDLSNVQHQLDAAERTIATLTAHRDLWAQRYHAAGGLLETPSIAPQAPIANLIIDENGECSATCMHAPGLPPGSHDVYLDPAAPGIPALAPYDPTKDVILLKVLNQIGTVKPGFDAALDELRRALHPVPAG